MLHPHKQIRLLRQKGYTYTEINKTLKMHIPRSSLAYICRGVALPVSYSEKIKKMNSEYLVTARIASAESSKRRFIAQHQLARESAAYTIGKPTHKTAMIALAMLYLGEGSKRSGFRGLALGSSDPLIVELYILLLNKVFAIPLSKLRARITYRADQNITELTEFWSAKTGIENKHFYKTAPDPRTIGKPTRKTSYMGVCTISCSGTDRQLVLQAYAEILLENLRGYSSVD